MGLGLGLGLGPGDGTQANVASTLLSHTAHNTVARWQISMRRLLEQHGSDIAWGGGKLVNHQLRMSNMLMANVLDTS